MEQGWLGGRGTGEAGGRGGRRGSMWAVFGTENSHYLFYCLMMNTCNGHGGGGGGSGWGGVGEGGGRSRADKSRTSERERERGRGSEREVVCGGLRLHPHRQAAK